MAVPSAVSEMFSLVAIFCTTSGKDTVIMAGYRASICPYLVPDGCNTGSSSISAPYRLPSLPSSRAGRVGQSQNQRTHVSVGFGVLFCCLKLVLAMEHIHTATICDFFVLLHIIVNCVFLTDLLCYQK